MEGPALGGGGVARVGFDLQRARQADVPQTFVRVGLGHQLHRGAEGGRLGEARLAEQVADPPSPDFFVGIVRDDDVAALVPTVVIVLVRNGAHADLRVGAIVEDSCRAPGIGQHRVHVPVLILAVRGGILGHVGADARGVRHAQHQAAFRVGEGIVRLLASIALAVAHLCHLPQLGGAGGQGLYLHVGAAAPGAALHADHPRRGVAGGELHVPVVLRAEPLVGKERLPLRAASAHRGGDQRFLRDGIDLVADAELRTAVLDGKADVADPLVLEQGLILLRRIGAGVDGEHRVGGGAVDADGCFLLHHVFRDAVEGVGGDVDFALG